MASSVDPDEMPRSVAYHLGLLCLPRSVCPNICTYGIYSISLYTNIRWILHRLVNRLFVVVVVFCCFFFVFFLFVFFFVFFCCCFFQISKIIDPFIRRFGQSSLSLHEQQTF